MKSGLSLSAQSGDDHLSLINLLAKYMEKKVLRFWELLLRIQKNYHRLIGYENIRQTILHLEEYRNDYFGIAITAAETF